MLRAVLAVVLVVAVLAVTQPAVQQGRRDHAATLLRGEVDGLVTAAADLVRTDEAVDGPGARRIVTVELPSAKRFSTGAHHVEITGGETPAIEWAADGGRTHRRVVEGFRVRTPDGEPLRLEGDGDRRLLLELTGPPGNPVVAVSRFQPSGGDRDA